MYISNAILLFFFTFSYTEDTYHLHLSFEQYVNEKGTNVKQVPREYDVDFEEESEMIQIIKKAQVEFGIKCLVTDSDGPFVSLDWILFEKVEGKWKKVSRKVSSEYVLLNRPYYFSIPLKERTFGITSLELELTLSK